MSNQETFDMKVDYCNICCDIYNSGNKKKIKCHFCDYNTCLSCFKKYCLSTSNEPNCMNCNKKWNREFLYTFLPKSFLNNELKKHQEDYLLEQEISLLPSTQIYLEYKNEAHKYLEESLKIEKEINRLQNLMNEKLDNYNKYYNKYANPRQIVDEDEKKVLVNNLPCPIDDCRGFINTKKWSCGICCNKFCKDCHEVLEEEHKCNPETVDSIKLIKNDTKQCPKCFTPIHKIMGCFDGDTLIPVYENNKTITKPAKEIRVNDFIIGDDGSVRKVEEIFQGEDKMFKINQDRGKSYTVNSKHMLVLRFMHHKKIQWIEEHNLWRTWYLDNNDMSLKMRTFFAEENSISKYKALENLHNHLKNIDENDMIYVTVENFIRLTQSFTRRRWSSLDSKQKEEEEDESNLFNYLYGIQVTRDFKKKYSTKITVEDMGNGKYYGWRFRNEDENSRFLLPDGTVVKNCDQIWCVICKTAFNWKTGMIMNGPIHNPHYFEYLRTLGKEDDEINNRFGENCGRNVETLLARLRGVQKRYYWRNTKIDLLYTYIQHLSHLENVELPKYVVQGTKELDNVDLRIEYLENKIDKDTMKYKIQRRNKRNMYKQNIYEVLRMYFDVSMDHLFEVVDHIDDNNVWSLFVDKTTKLKTYTDDNISKIKDIYGYKENTIGLTINI